MLDRKVSKDISHVHNHNSERYTDLHDNKEFRMYAYPSNLLDDANNDHNSCAGILNTHKGRDCNP
jgi:hypothetical protein